MNLRESIHWDKSLEAGLPDSRLVMGRERTTTYFGRMRMERVFCANCGGDGGLVTADWCPHIFYLCDACFAKHGGLPLPEIPAELVR